MNPNLSFARIASSLAVLSSLLLSATLAHSQTVPNGATAATTAPASIPAIPAAADSVKPATPNVAAPKSKSDSQMETIVVTGSAIPTTAAEVTGAPVDYITGTQIRTANSLSVLDALKRSSPSFAGGNNFGVELNNNAAAAGEAHIAFRNLPTLVLMDGKRIAVSPFSATVSTQNSPNINNIPLSFIDHIETLKDGGSTIYGSDAISGVVNVITKKNFNGAEFDSQFGFGEHGGYYSHKESIIGGISNNDTQFFGGAEYTYNNRIFSTDRPIASLSQDAILSKGGTTPGSNAVPSYFSPSAPGIVVLGGTRYILAGSPSAVGAPGYNPAITQPTGKAATNTPAGLASVGYIPVASLVGNDISPNNFLNTTQYGTYSYTPQEREQAFTNFDHDFYKNTADFYGSFLYSHNSGRSTLAPQPSGTFSSAGVTVPANNPFNPLNGDLGADAGAGTVGDVRYRFIDVGGRDSTQTDDFFHVVGGMKGDFGLGKGGDSDYHYDTNFVFDRTSSKFINNNYVDTARLNAALTPDLVADPTGRTNILGTPTYNPFTTTGANSPETLSLIRHQQYQFGISDLYDVNATMSGAPLELPGGVLGFAVGGEYRIEKLGIEVDPLAAAGGLVGTNPTTTFPTAERDTGAGFFELNMPIVGPDMKVPGFYSLSVDGSGRVEQIEDGADSEVAHISVKYQPINEDLTIRGNFSNSFKAPGLYSLYGPPSTTFANVNLADGTSQQQINQLSSPTLANSRAQNWGVGFVYSPKEVKGLVITTDYYNTIYETPSAPNFQSVVDSLEASGAASPYAPGFTFADGTKLATNAPNQIDSNNFNFLDLAPGDEDTYQKTSGFDFSINYVFPNTEYGQFTVGANGTYILNFDAQDQANGPFIKYVGTYTDVANLGGSAQGLVPRWQLHPYFTYEWGGLTYNLDASYIPNVKDRGDASSLTNENFNDYSADGNYYNIGDYYNLNTSVSYEFGKRGGFGTSLVDFSPARDLAGTGSDPKDMKDVTALSAPNAYNLLDGLRVTVGVNNVTDTDTPYVPSSSEDNTAKTNYDIIGRYFFMQLSKKF